MGVQVEMEHALAGQLVVDQLIYLLFNGVNWGVHFRVRIPVHSIQIGIVEIHAVVAPEYSIRIHHREDNEFKHLQKQVGLQTERPDQEVDNAHQAVSRPHFARMHSARDDDEGLASINFSFVFMGQSQHMNI